jgi:hypothetical protein
VERLATDFARERAGESLRAGPLTDTGRAAVVDGVRRCYESAGLEWPDRVVWTPSPVAGRLTAARLARRHTPAAVRLRAVAALVGRVVPVVVAGTLTFLPGVAVCCVGIAVTLLGSLPGDAVIAPSNEIQTFPPEHLRGMWVGGLAGGLAALVVFIRILIADDSHGIGSNLFAGVLMTIFAAVPAPALIAAFPGLGVSWLLGGFAPPSPGWVNLLLAVGLGSALVGAAVTGVAVRWRDRPPIPLHHPDPAHDRLTSLIAAVPAGEADVRSLVDNLTSRVHRSVEQAVEEATRDETDVRRYPVGHLGGHPHTGRLAAAAETAPDRADLRALVDASRAGWWWPHTAFVVISAPPTALRLERVGDTRRLHSTDGPAVEWADGTRVYAVHGTTVPAGLVEDGWDVETIHEHPNTEVRRAAIELIGWATFIRRAGWRLIATAADPGNPPHELALYEDPRRRLPGVRVLVMTNGSPDRSGTVRRHAETVPDTFGDPVAAAAWQYGCPVEVYRQLGRRT